MWVLYESGVLVILSLKWRGVFFLVVLDEI